MTSHSLSVRRLFIRIRYQTSTKPEPPSQITLRLVYNELARLLYQTALEMTLGSKGMVRLIIFRLNGQPCIMDDNMGNQTGCAEPP